MKKFAEPLGALNPFGAVCINRPDEMLPIDSNFNFSLKDAKALYRQLGAAIRKHERSQSKLVRSILKSNPWKKILRPRKWPVNMGQI